MKKLLQNILLSSYLVSWLVGGTMAQTPSITASSSPTVVIDKDIQQLKDKIANKVSEIRRQNNKAVSGFVVSNDGNIMKINNNSEENQVKFDDTLTKYFKIAGAQKKEIKADDIKKNDYAIVSGVVADNIISANVVLVDENFLVDSGKITEINKDSYNIKVSTSDKNIYSLDIETYTKQFIVNIKTIDLERVGFSKIKEGDTVHFVVKKTNEEKNNNYSAIKILIIPQEYFIK
jgi:Cu/Ag efflux protein CusF